MKNLYALILLLAVIGCTSSRRVTQRTDEFFRPLSATEINQLHNRGKVATPIQKKQSTLAARLDQTRVEPGHSGFKAEADSLRLVVSRLEKDLLIARNESLELRLKMANAATDAASRANRTMADQPALVPDKLDKSGPQPSQTQRTTRPTQDASVAEAERKPTVSLASVEKRLITPAERYTQALTLFNQRQYNKSLEQLERVQSTTTEKDLSTRSKYWMGENYFGLGEFARALRQFDLVATSGLPGKQPDACWMQARCHESMHEYALARQCFERLIKKFPSHRLSSLARLKLESSVYRDSKHTSEPDQTTV